MKRVIHTSSSRREKENIKPKLNKARERTETRTESSINNKYTLEKFNIAQLMFEIINKIFKYCRKLGRRDYQIYQ